MTRRPCPVRSACPPPSAYPVPPAHPAFRAVAPGTAPGTPVAPGAPALLVVAHGSRDPRHAATVRDLVAAVRAARPGVRVATGFLDFDVPPVPAALRTLAAEGVRRAVAQPLLLNHAFHAKTDIPAALRHAPAGTAVHQAAVLGPQPLLTAALERRLGEAGVTVGGRERAATGVVLATAGSSDPQAVAATEAMARRWERTGWHAVRPAFAAASAPRTRIPCTADAVRQLRAAGARRVVVAPYVLAPGRLPDRIARGAAEAGADALAGVLGAAPEVVRVLLQRYDEACGVAYGAVSGPAAVPALGA